MPLSAKQMEYLALAWQCFETEPKIDYNKFAQVAGLKTPASARELMRVTKKKLKEEYGALSSGMQSTNANGDAAATPAATPKAKATPKKRKTGEGEEESPTKKSKKGVKTEKVEEAEGEGEEVDNFFG